MSDCITDGDLESRRGSVYSDHFTPLKAHKFESKISPEKEIPLNEDTPTDGLQLMLQS